jgi:hypothetical protein
MKSLLAVTVALVVLAVSVPAAWGVWWPTDWCPPGCTIGPTALTYVIPVTRDTSISTDAIHTNDGAGKSISIGSGTATSGTFGLFAFDPAPVRTWLDAEMAASNMTLDSAVSACYVKVSFSVVPSGIGASPLAAGSPTFLHPIGLMAVNASDRWAEGNGLGGTAPYNWTTPYAATDASPLDYQGNTEGWHPSGLTMDPTGPILDGGVPFEKLTGQQNSATMNTWQYGVRSRVTLDPAVWMGLLYGRTYSPVTGAIMPGGPAVCGLKTYDMDTAMSPMNPVNTAVSVFSAEAGANLAPRLEVTLVGVHPGPWGYKPGDYNQDGVVDVVDLGVLAKYYDTNGGGPGTLSYSQGDIDGNGVVDVVDLGILAQNYDSGYAAPVPAPEPGTLSLLALGWALLGAKRAVGD